METPPFVAFPKIARWSRDVIVTEKIDGTNAQVFVSEDGQSLIAGSRNRWIAPGDDGFGFAAWVEKNREELLKLGPGSHFGEWWGSGVQRGYGLTKGEKRFSLFNISRWGDGGRDKRPSCCHVVPVLWRGNLDDMPLEGLLAGLILRGSVAAPGFERPEGIVIFHVASGQLFKKTLEDDFESKGEATARAAKAAPVLSPPPVVP